MLDEIVRHQRGPVDAVRGGVARRRRQRATGVGRERDLDRGGGERAADALVVRVLDRDPERRDGLLVGRGIVCVGAAERPDDFADAIEQRIGRSGTHAIAKDIDDGAATRIIAFIFERTMNHQRMMK